MGRWPAAPLRHRRPRLQEVRGHIGIHAARCGHMQGGAHILSFLSSTLSSPPLSLLHITRAYTHAYLIPSIRLHVSHWSVLCSLVRPLQLSHLPTFSLNTLLLPLGQSNSLITHTHFQTLYSLAMTVLRDKHKLALVPIKSIVHFHLSPTYSCSGSLFLQHFL